jgi:hypothetical protein
VVGIYQGQGYVLDSYASRDPMEIKENEMNVILLRNKVQRCMVESNMAV